MGQICCPPALDPPTPLHLKSKRYLQGLAIGIIPIAGLALACGGDWILQFFMSLFLVFFLFLSWRTFNWCIVLMFMIYALIFLVQTAVGLAGYIEYQELFKHGYVTISVFLILSTVYFLVAVPMSHYAYRVFRSGTVIPLLQQQQEEEIREQPMREEDEGQRRGRPRREDNGGGYFQGQAVRIG